MEDSPPDIPTPPLSIHNLRSSGDRETKIEESALDADHERSSIFYPPSSNGVGGRWSVVALLCCLALLLGGCLLTSGEQPSSDAQPTGGNFTTSFVSAEGEDIRTLDTGSGPNAGALNVFAIVEVEQGELRIDMLNPDGAVVFSVQGRATEQITKSGPVPVDTEGRLRYRVVARGARAGGYQILYQRPD